MATAQSTLLNLGRLDALARQESPIHRLDPRAKLITILIFIVCVVSFPKYTLSAMIPYFLFPVTLLLVGNLPAGYLLQRIILISPFAILLGIFNPLLDREVLFHAGPVAISGGWISFLSILFRFFLTVSSVLILIAATGFDAVCMAMQKLKIPRILSVQLLFLYRYLFVLTEEAARLIRARSLRSFDGRGTGMGVLGSLIGGLLLRTLDRAERISQAMHCRGFDGHIRVYRDLRFQGRDFLFIFAWSVLFLFFRFVNVSEFVGHLVTGQPA